MATFLISDTHFGHNNTCVLFKREDGSPLRPFKDAEEMDEVLVKNWNETVGPKDKVYHLGDVVINKKFLHILHRLNGDKVLIRGNHDIFDLKDYTPFFRDIRGVHVLGKKNKFILSHIPLHPDSKGRFAGNIHGHLHANVVMQNGKVDPWYQCVCVEQTDYRPILLDHVIARYADIAQ